MTYQGQAGTPSTGTDPAYVPDREVFDAYTHQQIWDLARERLAPAELRRVADAWGRTADALESAFDEHARELTRLSGEWSGIAAGAAARAATALVQAGDSTVEVCRVLRHLMTANSDAAESVRAAIPPPPEPYRPDPDAAVEAATGAQRRTAHNLATAAATATAQDAMAFGYNPTIPASGDSVPRFPAVFATAPEGPGIPAVSERGPGQAPNTGPGTTVEADSESPGSDPPESATSHIDGDGDGAPVTLPGRAGDGSQPALGNASTPTPTAPENESPPAGAPSDSAPEAGSPAYSPAPQPESPPPDNTPAPGSPQPPDAPAADTAPAASSAPDTRHARSEPAVQPSSAPVDRGTGPAISPGVTDLSPRSPAGPPTAGVTAPIPPGPGASSPIPAGPSPASPAPAGPVPSSPGATGGGAAPGHSSSTGGTSGPAHAPGTNTPQHRPAPGGTPDPDAPVDRTPTTSGSTAAPGPAAVPNSPVPSIRPPAGNTDPVVHPPLPGEREALGPAGTGPNSSTAEGPEHPGQRPVRLVPTGMPLPSSAGVPPSRPADSERTSPDYLHAPNEALTASDPKVPPVLGEYTETERAERDDLGGGSR